MSRSILVAVLGASFSLPAVLASAAEPYPSGLWSRSDGNARVRFERCGADLCARNVWIGDTSGGEAVGDVLIMKLKPESAGSLAGTAYDPKRKLTYAVQISVSKSQLKTRGCVLGGLVCKTVSWTRLR